MIAYLGEALRLSPVQAGCLHSAIVDLWINQVMNSGVMSVCAVVQIGFGGGAKGEMP